MALAAKRYKIESGRNPRCLINLRKVFQISSSFLTRTLRLKIVLHAMGKVLGFGLELRWIARRVQFVDPGSLIIGAQIEPFIGECAIYLQPAF